MNAENSDLENFKHIDISEAIIKAFYKVYNSLGHGFLEKVYVNALCIQLRKQNLVVQKQAPIQVYYDKEIIGDYFADILVNDCIVVEIKAVKNLTNEHEAQLLNYLKATSIETGLLLNFGLKPEIKRKAFNNTRK